MLRLAEGKKVGGDRDSGCRLRGEIDGNCGESPGFPLLAFNSPFTFLGVEVGGEEV